MKTNHWINNFSISNRSINLFILPIKQSLKNFAIDQEGVHVITLIIYLQLLSKNKQLIVNHVSKTSALKFIKETSASV